MKDWKPIATAPKEGLVWLYSPEQEFDDCGQFVGMWFKAEQGGGYWMDEADQRDLVKWPPTHWRPLPDPPNKND